MPLRALEGILKRSIGLDAASIGRSAVARAVRERKAVCRVDTVDAYIERVRASNAELQAFIEAIVVPETWFFRDAEAFAALGRLAREANPAVLRDGVFRVLSLPCSTGEEPYSMAMALLDAGAPEGSFHIDAVDVSHRALMAARIGEYARGAFRGSNLEYRDRYFTPLGSTHRIADVVRRHVHFQPGNLLKPLTHPTSGPYDAIFCRNVLIYFDRATQDRAVALLQGLLAPEGSLFVGSAETNLLFDHGLASAKIPRAYAFRRAAPKPPPRGPSPRPRSVRPIAPPPPVRPSSIERDRALEREGVDAVEREGVGATAREGFSRALLEEAHALANQGHVAEAARRCEEHLRRAGPSAEAFHLLGLLRDAAGHHVDAAACYRKALYLDPNHEESLVHLALLLETQDNRGEAALLWTRARRLTSSGGASA